MLAIVFGILGALGTLLGIAVVIVKPFVTGNKERWRSLREILGEQDLESMARSLSDSGVLDDVYLTKLKAFARCIEQDAESVRFRGPFAGMISRSLNRVLELHRRWNRVIDVPWFRYGVIESRRSKIWHIETTTLDIALSVSRQEGNQQDARAEARRFAQETSGLLDQMRAHLHRVYELANREVIEYLSPWNLALAINGKLRGCNTNPHGHRPRLPI